jgi:hypothetical protein
MIVSPLRVQVATIVAVAMGISRLKIQHFLFAGFILFFFGVWALTV